MAQVLSTPFLTGSFYYQHAISISQWVISVSEHTISISQSVASNSQHTISISRHTIVSYNSLHFSTGNLKLIPLLTCLACHTFVFLETSSSVSNACRDKLNSFRFYPNKLCTWRRETAQKVVGIL